MVDLIRIAYSVNWKKYDEESNESETIDEDPSNTENAIAGIPSNIE